MDKIVMAVDGPAGAGKSTICRLAARKLGIEYIDTGAMYRAITLKIIRDSVELNNNEELEKLLEAADIYFVNGKVFLNGEDISEEIRMPYVNKKVSDVAAIEQVRIRLVDMQRKMAGKTSVIMDGRDIGTNVLKDANIKIYLTASVEERARRRFKESIEKNMNVSYEDIYRDIENRDRIDSSRKVNPLCIAEDAILLDTTSMNIDQVVEKIINIASKIRE